MRTVVDWMRDRLQPSRQAEPELGHQERSLSEVLPHEVVLGGLGRPVVLLDGGSVGVIWELELVEHEVLPAARLEEWSTTLAGCVQGIVDPDVVFQVILDSRPSFDFDRPAWWPSMETPAREFVGRRVDAISARSGTDAPALRTMRRRLYLTLRVEGQAVAKRRFSLMRESVEQAIGRQSVALGLLVARLNEHAQVVEEGLNAVGWAYARCEGPDVLDLLRSQWNDVSTLTDGAGSLPYNPEGRLRDQVCRGHVRMAPEAVQVGDDTWECVSWLEQPTQVYHGLFSSLLELACPFRAVVCLRPCRRDGDLALSAQTLKPATDERGIRHREELQHVERQKAYGEQLLCVAVHLFVVAENTNLSEVGEHGYGRSLANRLSVVTRMPWIHEKHFCPGLMLLCQPLGYTPEAGRVTARERRVLSGAVAPYLPIYGGYSGTKGGSFAPSKHTQLMVSRAGDPLWLSCRDADTAPHLAVLASTGGGKSFFMVNYMTAELAAEPDSLVFIIDSITSYRVFGEVMGEDDGFLFARPPASFPNIFLGVYTPERVQTIVGILLTAITLEDPTVTVTSEHRQLLGEALVKTYADSQLDASTVLGSEGLEVGVVPEGMQVPRLSLVVDNLVSVAETLSLSIDTAKWLRVKLGSYYGTGSYAKFFDQHAVVEAEEQTPRVMLFDLAEVSDDPNLSTLTMVCCIAEIQRHLRRPENVGRKGMLVVDEAGVLASGSAELERFVKEAWKTFRKLGVICAGLTNEVDDYREKAAPRTMWANSPNKVLLRLSSTEVEKLGMADESRGIPRLISEQHLQDLAGSLRMKKGVYSHGLWVCEKGTGTFVYEPTGHDYWLAASKPLEVQSFLEASEHFRSARKAVSWLAEHHPFGIRDERGELVGFKTLGLS